ncbi:MAG: RHS repeat-associated core domain-containing protein, partial [Patescibacteria group bacterium]|nr:RHS repeat-associated core domain-containing protein [Patescibacteria group bacterium]
AMPIAAAWGKHLDELYGYDRLHRLVDFDRGKLIRDDDLIDPMVRKAQWTLDATGNWSRFRRFDQSDSTAALDQTRTHNGVNEVTDIGETVGRVWISPTHDRAGNMLVIPRPSDARESYTATFDAWHRLVKLEQSDGAGGLETVAEYQYDGRNFRIVKRTYTGGVLSETRHFYYSSQWQVLEERVDDSPAADSQYVWGPRYIDDLVLRDRDTTGDGLLDERFYALQDANWNVIAISNPDCQIQERYAYDAYGSLAVHNGAFTPIPASLYAWPYTYTGRRFDEETGLMHYRNRMYHTEMGRFVTRDPVGYADGMSSYRAYFVPNHVDPLGLCRICGPPVVLKTGSPSTFDRAVDGTPFTDLRKKLPTVVTFLGLTWNDVTPDAIGLAELTNQAGQITVDGQVYDAQLGAYRAVHLGFYVVWPVDESNGPCAVFTTEITELITLDKGNNVLGTTGSIQSGPTQEGRGASWTVAKSKGNKSVWPDCRCNDVLIYFDAPGSIVQESAGSGFRIRLKPTLISVYDPNNPGSPIGEAKLLTRHSGTVGGGKQLEYFEVRGSVPAGGQTWPPKR